MGSGLGRLALFAFAGIGGAAALLYMSSGGDRGSRPRTPVADDRNPGITTTEPTATQPPRERPDTERAISIDPDQGATNTEAPDAGPVAPAPLEPETSSDPGRDLAESLLARLTEQPSLDEPGIDLQNLDDSTAELLGDLLDSVSIRCEFDPGNGATWRAGGLAQYHDAEFRGGPIQYDAIDFPLGTATMITSFSERQVQAIATRIGLQFSMFAPSALWLTTVFAERDASGRYPAVLSTLSAYSERSPDAAQFYGVCETVLVSLESLER